MAALIACSELLDSLKGELPNVSVYHVITRWLQTLSQNLQEALILKLLFRTDTGDIVFDGRMETFIEELFGIEVWEALCKNEDPSRWKNTIGTSGFKYRGGLIDTPEYQLFRRALSGTPFKEHDCNCAEAVDNLVWGADVRFEHAEHAWDYAVNLLSGDVVTVVTHLRSEWMQVRRRDDEFLGQVLERIDVAQHPKLGDVGAACKFRFPLPNLQGRQVYGELDTEGEMTLRSIPVLTPAARTAVKAAVAQTLVAVLVPSLKDTLPPKPIRGARTSYTGEIWATRPVIHTLGEIGRDRGIADIESGGTRIHPVYADGIFRWLTDEAVTNPYPLFHRVKEREGNVTEPCFRLFKDAKAELLARRLALSDVFARLIKAYARPLAIWWDDGGQVCVKKMSARAQRNYQRHRDDGFRALDFSPVKKTYQYPDGRRVVVDVPRTFIHGTFYTLQEVFAFVFDSGLRAKVQTMFSGDYSTPEIR